MSSRTDGFLLLEALIGLAIIGIVSVALLATTGAQVRAADQASVLLVASSLAQDRMAAIRILDYEGLSSPPDSLLEGRFAPPFDEFAWSARVEPAAEEYDLFAIEVEVTGRGQSYPVQTMVHRPDPLLTTAAGEGS